MRVQRKRIAALLMAGAMLFSTLPVNALAVENPDTGGLCEHHPEHTAECGYTEGAEGTPCQHEHTEDCYTLLENCVHSHTDECYPQESVSGDVATPSDADKAEPVCGHVCSEESSCIVKELDCQHEHDADCGYTEAVPGTSCAFGCGECNAETGEPEKDKCICDAPCTEEAVNADCAVCSADGADLTACEGKACVCGVLCTEETINTDCTVCGADLTACKGKTEPEQARQITITGFDQLPEEVAAQIVPAGTKLEELGLPTTLGASGYVGTQDSGGAEHLTIKGVTWKPDHPYDENAQGPCLFTANLPEGYALLDGVSLPEISVTVEPVNLLAAAGDLQVDNGKLGTDYDYADNTLTIKTDKELTISGTTTNDRIVIADNVKAKIAFNGLSIQLSEENACAFMIPGSASATITLNGDNNTLKSGKYAAGLAVMQGGTVTIKGEGPLHSTGGNNAAGIGGGHTFNAGTINIESGNITAVGGGDGAAIGGGHSNDDMDNQFGLFDAINITGGVIDAETSGNAAAIGTGCWASTCPGEILIQNAKVTAETRGGHKRCAAIGRGISKDDNDYDCKVTIINSVVDAKNVNGNTISGEDGTPAIQNSIVRVNAGSENNNAYVVYGQATLDENFTLEDGETLVIPEDTKLTVDEKATLTNNGTIQNAGTISGTIQNEGSIQNAGKISGTVQNEGSIYNKGTIDPAPTGNGTVIEIGNGVEYIDIFPVVIDDCGEDCKSHTIKQSSESSGAATNTITVTGGKHTITIEGINIDTTTGNAILLQGDANVTLTLSGENTLKPGQTYAGICVPENTKLTIEGGGSLDVTGGRNNGGGAAIGGDAKQRVGSIQIAGGKINAHAQGDSGAGIGWGGHASGLGGSVLISGGYVKSSGGGDEKSFRIDSKVQITGGIVEVQDEKLNDDNADKKDCLIWVGNTATVYGTFTIDEDFTLESGKTLLIPAGAELAIPTNMTLSNSGIISNLGTISGEGAIDNQRGATINNTGEIAETIKITNNGEIYNSGKLPSNITGNDPIPLGEGDQLINAGPVKIGDCGDSCESHKIVGNGQTTGNTITVTGGIHKITIKDVKIDTTTGNAILLENGAEVALTLSDDNTLQPGEKKAGICVPEGTKLTIDGDGSLDVTGGRNNNGSAAIGGNQGQNIGSIHIAGGSINAHADNNCGAGIGYGGRGGGAGAITISGGHVTASGSGGEGSFYLNDNSQIKITGGVVEVPDNKLDSAQKKDCLIIVSGNGTVSGKFTLNEGFTVENGKTLTIPEGTELVLPESVTLTNNGTISNAGIISGTGTIQNNSDISNSGEIKATVKILNSGTIYNSGTMPEVESGTVHQVPKGAHSINLSSITIDNSCGDSCSGHRIVGTGEPTGNTITVTGGVHEITIENVNINTTNGNAIRLENGAEVRLILADTNTLQPAQGKAGICVPENTVLNISGDGSLDVTGGQNGAGIGADQNSNVGTIIIAGGDIDIHPQSGGAGIGLGGGSGSGGVISITGGHVVIENGGDSFRIGDNSQIQISGGIVEVQDDKLDNAQKTNCLIWVNDTGTVYGTFPLEGDVTLAAGKTLTIPQGATLVLENGRTLTNSGAIYNYGKIAEKNATIQNNGTIYDYGDIEPKVTGKDVVSGTYEPAPNINDGPVKIAGNNLCGNPCQGHKITGTGSTSNTITITGGEHNITIENVNIDTTTENAILLENGAEVALTLSGDNILKPGEKKAGICVPKGTKLTIDGEGSLDVTGGRGGSGENGGAGIGADVGGSIGTIIITSGDIYAHAHDNNGGGAGIGYGGWGGSGGAISITGGHVAASGKGGEGSFYVGDSSQIQITGGVVEIEDDKLNNAQKTNCLIWVNDAATVYGKYTLDTSLTLTADQTLEIPQGAELVIPGGITLTNNVIRNEGTISGAGTIDNNSGAIFSNGTIATTVKIIPEDSIGTIDISKRSVVIDDLCGIPCLGHIITGNNQQTTNTITVTGGSHNITLKNVNIDASGAGACAFSIASGASVSLTLERNNNLKSGGANAGVYVPSGAELEVLGDGDLTVAGSSSGWGQPAGAGIGGSGIIHDFGEITFKGSGTIKATGGSMAAGIGGGNSGGGSKGRITIESGNIFATGGINAAGIGGGKDGTGGIITISGGVVQAKGGELGAGIGGGRGRGNSATITITGGTVTAYGGGGNDGIGWGPGAGIGGGSAYPNSTHGGTVIITGGSVKAGLIKDDPKANGQPVRLGIVSTNGDVTDVSVDGKPYYTSGHKDEKKLYLYMTGENHTVTIRDKDGKVTTYKNVPYVENSVDGNKDNGYFNFAAVTPSEDTPTESRDVSFTKDEYTATYAQTEKVELSVKVKENFSAKVWNFLTRSRPSAAMDSVHIAVTPENETVPVVAVGPYAAKVGENAYELDVSKLDAGTYTLTAWYGGSADSKPADADTATLTINPASLQGANVSLVRTDATYNKQSHQNQIIPKVEWNGRTLVSGKDYTVSFARDGQETSDFTTAGKITVVVTGQGNFAETNSAIFTIQPKELTPTITYTTNTKEYDGNTSAPAGMGIKLTGVETGDTVSATATFAYNSASVPGAAIITTKGITLQGDDAGNYKLPERLPTVGGSITKSNPAAPDTPTAAEKTDTSITLKEIPGAEYSMDGKNWQSHPVFDKLERNTAYTFHARIKGTMNTNVSPASSATITTSKTSLAGATVTVTGAYTYNGQPQTPTVEVKLGDGTILTENTDYTVRYSPDDLTAAGSIKVTATGTGGFDKEAYGTFNINKALAPTITWPTARALTYGQKLSDSALSGGTEGFGDFAWSNPNTVPTVQNSGYPVLFTASEATENNYEKITITTKNVAVKVEKAKPALNSAIKISGEADNRSVEITVTITGKGGDQPTGTIKLVGKNGLAEQSLPLNNGTATHTWTGLQQGEYQGTITYSGNGNYEEVSEQFRFDTRKQQQTIKIAETGAKTYGDEPFTLSLSEKGSGTGTVTYASSDPAVLSISGTTATIKKAGNVTITAKKAEDNDYKEAEDTLSLSIDRRAITVTADSFTIVTGAALPALTYQITSGSLVGTDRFTTDPTLFTKATDTNTVREYDITISGGTLDNSDSYDVTYVNGKLIVTDKTPVQLTLTANPATLSGGGAVTLTLTGLPAGGTATISCSDSSITVSGSGTSWTATLPNRTAAYTFTANYSGDAQHTSAEATCTVSVTKRTSGGGSSSGGSGGSSTITDRPDENDPDSPTTSQTQPVKPDKGGSVAIGGGDVQDAINKATSDANKNGNQKNGIAVTVPVSNAADANSLTITIPAAALDKLVTAKVWRFDITTNGLPRFSFTLDTLQMLDKQSQGGDLILRLTKTAVTSAEAKAAIGTRPAYDITLVWVQGGKETPLTDWQGQTISVKLPYIPATGEQAGNLYAVSVDASGKVEWLTKSSYDADQKAVLFEATHFSVYGVGYKTPAPVFNDISGHWAEEHILFVASRGLLNGTGNSQFSPNTGMTRGMFVTALGRLAGIDPASYQSGRFADVAANAYYAPYVNWAAQTGIVNGTSATTFSPDTNVTREQMAVMMANYADKLGYELPATLEAVTFADNGKISTWSAEAVKAMQQAGILAGKDGKRFDPQGTATRAEVATVLHRFVEVVIDPQAANGWTENASGTRSYYKGGKPAIGWLYDEKWYWLENGGIPFAGGWKQIGGKWYFFNPDGTMAVNTTIDGYTIGPDGARK